MANRRLAIDASIWIYQFQMTMRDKKTGDALQNAHIMGTFRRIIKLLFHGIKPVFVFDGDAPMLKKRTIAERKRRKAGATKDLAKTAQQLLSAQMRAAAAEHQLRRQQAKDLQNASRPRPDTELYGDTIDPQNVVYLDDLETAGGAPAHTRATPSRQSSRTSVPPPPAALPSPRKYIPKDQYALPSLDGSVQAQAKPSDPRIATEAELRQFIDDMRPEDFDIDSDFFGNLPVEIKYEIIGDLRIKSRQVNHKRTERMRQAATPIDFSRQQIENLMQRNTLTQKLFEVTETVGQASISIPTRVAGQKNREYVLVKQDGEKGGGWVFGIKNPELNSTEPIILGGESEDESDHQRQEESGTDSDEFDEVEVSGKPRTPSPDPETRRILAIEAIRARYAPTGPAPEFDPYLDEAPFLNDSSLFIGGDDAPTNVEMDDVDTELQASILKSLLASEEKEIAEQMEASERQARIFSRVDAAGLGRNRKEVVVERDSQGGGFVKPQSLSAVAQQLATTMDGSGQRRVENGVPAAESDDELEYVDLPADYRYKSPPPAMAQATPLLTEAQQPPSAIAKPDTIEIDDSDDSADFDEVPMDVSLPVQSPAATPAPTTLAASPPVPSVEPSPPPPPLPPAPVSSLGTREPSLDLLGPDRSSEPEEAISAPAQPGGTFLSVFDSILPSDSDDSDNDVQRPPLQAPRTSSAFARAPPASTSGTKPIPSPVKTAFDKSTISVPAPDPRPHRPPPSSIAPRNRDDGEEEPAANSSSKLTLDSVPVPSGTASPVQVGNGFGKENVSAPAQDVTDQPEDKQGDSDEEVFFDEEWEKSPTPPRRERRDSSGLFRPDFEEEVDFGDDEEDMDLEREIDGYADMVSQLNNRNLSDMRDQAQSEVATLVTQRNAEGRNADGATRQMASDIKEMLRLFGIPYVDAPQEAEAECAELLNRHLVDGIVTDDSDVFLFGGQRIYRHMFNDAKYVECYLLADLERELGLDRDKLVKLAYLLGGDYADGLPGVGPVLGRELLEEFEGERALNDFKEWWWKVQSGKDDTEEDTNTPWKRKFKRGHKNLFIDENWPDPAIARAYYRPSVNEDDEPFSWAGPDLDGLRNFLSSHLSWSTSKTDEIMLPLIKRTNDRKQGKVKTQSNLSDYFDFSAGIGPLGPRAKRSGYASGRLQNVVQTWRQKKAAENQAKSSQSVDEPELPLAAVIPKAEIESATASPSTSTKDLTTAAVKPPAKRKAPAKAKAKGPAKSTAASRKTKEAARRKSRAAARGGEMSSEEEALLRGPVARALPSPPLISAEPQPRPRPRRVVRAGPVVDDDTSESDSDRGRPPKRRKDLGVIADGAE